MKAETELLREAMADAGIDVYLIFTSDPHGSEYIDAHYRFREYISGFTGSYGTLLISRKKAILWTDGRYMIQAGNELKGSGIDYFIIGEEGSITLKDYLREHVPSGLTIGLDGDCTCADFMGELEELKDKDFNICLDAGLCERVFKNRPPLTTNSIRMLADDICGRSVKDKLAEIRELIRENKADGFLASDLNDVMWIFNLRGSDISCNPVAFSYAYISEDKACLFVHEEKLDKKASQLLTMSGIMIMEYDSVADFFLSLEDKEILADPSRLSMSLYDRIALHNRIKEIRSHRIVKKHIKNAGEIGLARKYCVLDSAALVRFIIFIKERVKQSREINEYMAAQYLDALRGQIEGFICPSFTTISAYKENAAIVHYAPPKEGSKVLKAEGMLLVDSGGQYEGATTDVTRTVLLGPISDLEKLHYTIALRSMLDLMDAVFLDGLRGENLDIIARQPLWQYGLDYRHGTGHGIGAMLSVHEGPQAIRYKINDKEPQPKLEEGMLTSDEPGIYIEGSHGIRHENELLCIEKFKNGYGRFLGFTPLTLVPFERDAIIAQELNAHEKDILNDYHRRVYEGLSPHLNDSEKKWLKKATEEI